MLDIRRGLLITPLAVVCALGIGCAGASEPTESPVDMETAAAAAPMPAATLPPTEETAPDALNTSPRHGEWVDVMLPGSDVPINTWVVYPERPDSAPVVLVIHEIYGMTDWIRGVADQFAAEGFIAVAPDLLSGMGPDGGGTDSLGERDNVVATIRTLEVDERTRRLNAVRTYALDIPSGNGRLGSVGFCWGGGASFAYAVDQPELNAAVVYYGTSPAEDTDYTDVNAPVLGLYGGSDERVNASIPRAEEAMAAAGKAFEPVVFDGAGHGFLRAQLGQDGANLRATDQAWPRTVAFFREHLGD
jgi:carboxymethylenebutenolidase